jgi:hypothetical protein
MTDVLHFRGLDMKYEVAKELIQHLKEIDVPTNAAMLTAEKIEDLKERREIRRALAKIVGSVYTDLMVPIGREFPELLPDDDAID